jgi:hypothetical protein
LVKYLLLMFLFFSAFLKAQFNDTVKVVLPVDTLRADTMSVADSLAVADTTGLLSDSLNIIFADTIRPLYQRPLYPYSRFINKREFIRRNYSYAGDIFGLTPFFFEVSPGVAGHPANMLIYGTGASQTSWLMNGISYNDYSSFPFDLNRIQTEYIDSAEVIPLTRGFLYGPFNNSSAVNFIGNDFISVIPFTRIRYFEGPFGEGYFDGMFNSIITGRMNLFVEVTNRKTDERYVNSDFGKWNARAQLKYLLNNNINFLSGYEYSNTYTGIFGGVDILGDFNINGDFYEELYDQLSAPVVYDSLRFNSYTNSLFLKTLGSFGNFSFTDFTLYYRFNRIELNQPGNVPGNMDNLFRNKIAGLSLNQHLYYSIFNLNLLANFEKGRIDEHTGYTGSLTYLDRNAENYSLAGVFSLSLFDSVLHPSAFCKISSQKIPATGEHSGYGTDVTLRLDDFTNIYAGYSRYQNTFASGYIDNIQTGIRYSHMNFHAGLSLFSRKGSIVYNLPDTLLNINSQYFYPRNNAGISMDMNVLLSRIQLEGKVDYYRENDSEPQYVLPPVYAAGGVYYRDSLFNGNLDLKSGFSFYYYGRRSINLSAEQFSIFRSNTVGPDFRLDLFVSGEIQGSAVIFFAWENLLDARYFLIPFYPMPPRGVRFGVNWELFN